MSTFGRPAGAAPAPLIVSRSQDNDIILRWQQQDPDTGQVTPVDLTPWTITVPIYSPHGEVWATYTATKDVDGVVLIGPSAARMSDPAWASRMLGTYRVVAKKTGRTVVLADDTLRIV